MKRVVTNDELKEKMDEAIELLCGTVKKTLGPKGSNIIIDHSSFSPFITNDGVTIARNIESDDEIVNTILELAKEASIKTDDKVGDGTTTTLVLLESIYIKGRELIDNGINPIMLKKELDNYLPTLIEKINKKSFLPKRKDFKNIATISANSEEIGNIVGDVYYNIKDKKGIRITETNKEKTEVIYKLGYTIDTLIASNYFFKDSNIIDLDETCVLIMNNYIDNLEKIATIINHIIENKKSLVIFAEEYSDLFINEVLSLYLHENINIYLLKIPEYGKNKLDILSDLEFLCKCKIIENLDYISLDVLGKFEHIKIGKNETIISFKKDKNVDDRVKKLISLLNNDLDDINIDFLKKRIAMFNNGLAEIKVGALTDAERREKKMRFEDALCAVESSKEGILPGSGIVLYEIANTLDDENVGAQIFKVALEEPFKQIMINSGLNYKEIIEEIKSNNYKKIYNIFNESFEDVNETEVLDTLAVVINSLVNSVSIAGMLLTTTSLIINEYQNNINKVNDYGEL